jgi:hypothetical protein
MNKGDSSSVFIGCGQRTYNICENLTRFVVTKRKEYKKMEKSAPIGLVWRVCVFNHL